MKQETVSNAQCSPNDASALSLGICSITMLINYLSAHKNGTNRNPWKDKEITNSRNEIRDVISKTKNLEIVELMQEVLNQIKNIKNDKIVLAVIINNITPILQKCAKLHN